MAKPILNPKTTHPSIPSQWNFHNLIANVPNTNGEMG